uniref:uncharacterized protein LOC125907425 isoform X1 n=1 Tax=Anopheles coluzzii TaxID=1518534 RepID=UPI0020FFCD1D|nr:uncharacterized protein LOC125907425 isoform X1 [Anopheles coluzzii]
MGVVDRTYCCCRWNCRKDGCYRWHSAVIAAAHRHRCAAAGCPGPAHPNIALTAIDHPDCGSSGGSSRSTFSKPIGIFQAWFSVYHPSDVPLADPVSNHSNLSVWDNEYFVVANLAVETVAVNDRSPPRAAISRLQVKREAETSPCVSRWPSTATQVGARLALQSDTRC